MWQQRRQGRLVVPACRSSHRMPTINGGAIGIVLVALGLLLYLQWPAGLHNALLAVSPFALAGVAGYLDDHHQLSGRVKLILTAVAVCPLLFGLNQSLFIVVFISQFTIPVFIVLPVAFFGMLWIIHLTNFMDGINGLAVLQVVFMLLATCFLGQQLNLTEVDRRFIIGVVVACLAFLPFNFPYAKIFLGDTGSLFLGMLMAWLLLLYLQGNNHGLWAFLTLFSLFWVDTTLTLFRRLRRGKSVFEAHREHAYQHLANEIGQSHIYATGLIMLVNLVWLLPMAYVVLISPYPILWFLLAILPVFCFAFILRAGQKVAQ